MENNNKAKNNDIFITIWKKYMSRVTEQGNLTVDNYFSQWEAF